MQCPKCESEAVDLRDGPDDYAECRRCGFVWELDGDDDEVPRKRRRSPKTERTDE